MVSCCTRFMNSKAKANEQYFPTYIEQVANTVTHGVFILPTIICLYKMVGISRSGLHVAVSWVYGLTLVLLFSISTSFHLISLSGKFKYLRSILHLGDRFMIYLFIAASYMPWLLLQDLGTSVEYLVWAIWSAAVSGIFYSVIFHEKYKMLETILYLCLGILPSIPLVHKASKGLFELAAGGFFYVSGIYFFKSDGVIPFAHAIWHLFAATGCGFHLYGAWTHLY